ncbi:hypothetical protein [Flavobacterium cerinum]|uniref:Uncharacterized protein n=1 Tax=Flavobacterium cerinum TaxID=2502784 RepID=A0ABY5IZZ3_9FLAO|nr:hypothetical protein [Flavobacterium cerinum]UUC47298.1 hypothetical protein NOX80_08875 [Flavobacterium cerinum]
MKKILFTGMLLIAALNLNAQTEKIQLVSKNYEYKADEQFYDDLFDGITKLKFHFEDPTLLLGKSYQIILQEYTNGKLSRDEVVLNTKKEGLPKIDKEFSFYIYSQQCNGKLKLGFFFKNFINKKMYPTNKIFEDGTFDLRDVTGDTGKIDFETDKNIQIALITPPNENPAIGNLGYCEVSKGNIDVKSWYAKYKIPQFFLIYLKVE